MRRRATITCCAAAALALAACGGSQNGPGANKAEGSGTYTVEVPTASFPALQRLDRPSVMKVAVRNAGDRTIPNVAVSVTTDNEGTSAPAFAKRDSQRGLAAPYQPVWILDIGPIDGDNALANTWTLGTLAAGETKTFVWHVHPIRTGNFSVRWKVAPATLGGEAKLASGAPAEGILPVEIDGKAPSATIGPDGLVKKKYSN